MSESKVIIAGTFLTAGLLFGTLFIFGVYPALAIATVLVIVAIALPWIG